MHIVFTVCLCIMTNCLKNSQNVEILLVKFYHNRTKKSRKNASYIKKSKECISGFLYNIGIKQ